MNPQLSAIIDLGTNTFHLLIANETKEIVYEEKVPVRMGVGGINQGIITPDGVLRTVDCMVTFAKKCKEFGVTNIQAFGTSALRNASNAPEIVNEVKSKTGITVQIISGDAEAGFIYQGVRAAVPLGKGKNLIVDIGGGSVEFIIGNEMEIFWKQSFEVGGQRLQEKFHQHDPILKEELSALQDYLSIQLLPLVDALQKHKPSELWLDHQALLKRSATYIVSECKSLIKNFLKAP